MMSGANLQNVKKASYARKIKVDTFVLATIVLLKHQVALTLVR